jgi:hypothetical protein
MQGRVEVDGVIVIVVVGRSWCFMGVAGVWEDIMQYRYYMVHVISILHMWNQNYMKHEYYDIMYLVSILHEMPIM